MGIFVCKKTCVYLVHSYRTEEPPTKKGSETSKLTQQIRVRELFNVQVPTNQHNTPSPLFPRPTKTNNNNNNNNNNNKHCRFPKCVICFFLALCFIFFLLCEIEQSVYHQIKMVSLHESKGWGYPEFMYGILLAMMFFLFFCGCVY